MQRDSLLAAIIAAVFSAIREMFKRGWRAVFGSCVWSEINTIFQDLFSGGADFFAVY
jgi:hypothetical protein